VGQSCIHKGWWRRNKKNYNKRRGITCGAMRRCYRRWFGALQCGKRFGQAKGSMVRDKKQRAAKLEVGKRKQGKGKQKRVLRVTPTTWRIDWQELRTQKRKGEKHTPHQVSETGSEKGALARSRRQDGSDGIGEPKSSCEPTKTQDQETRSQKCLLREKEEGKESWVHDWSGFREWLGGT